MDFWAIVDPIKLTDPGHLFGHLTYALLILSVLMRKMVWLRTLAVASGVTKIIYRTVFVFDPISILWETLFVLVNVGQLLLIWWENRAPSYTPEEQHFIDVIGPSLPPATARRLLRSGKWMDAAAGEKLTVEGERVQALTFISSGQVQIARNGVTVGACGPGDFLGEMTYASGRAATATAITTEPARLLSFERRALEAAQSSRPMLRIALQASFNRNLIDKLLRSNEALAPVRT